MKTITQLQQNSKMKVLTKKEMFGIKSKGREDISNNHALYKVKLGGITAVYKIWDSQPIVGDENDPNLEGISDLELL